MAYLHVDATEYKLINVNKKDKTGHLIIDELNQFLLDANLNAKSVSSTRWLRHLFACIHLVGFSSS